MSSTSVTIASIIDGVGREYGRMTPELSEVLPERIGEWFSEVASEFPFWFMTSFPDSLGASYFPFANPPVYTNLAESVWFGQGWMHSNTGQADYYISLPDDTANPLTTTWRRQDVGQIEYVKSYSISGGRARRELEITDPEHLLAVTDYGRNSEPVACALFSTNNQSFIRFAPTPDTNQYIFAVSVKVRDFPALITPEQTNPLIINYPQTVRTAGCIIAAEYFGDGDRMSYYEKKMYGEPAPLTGKRNKGLINKMRKDTQRRRWQRTDTAEYWTSPPYSTDRRLRYTSSTGYYVNP